MAQCSLNGYFLAGRNLGGPLVSTAVPLVELVAGPTDYVVITEIGIYLTSGGAGAQPVGLGVPAAQGVGYQSFSPPGIAYDPNNTASALAAYTVWQTPPTAPTKYIRRFTLNPQSALASISTVLKFPRGIKMSPSSSLVLYNPSPVNFRLLGGEYWVEYDG